MSRTRFLQDVLSSVFERGGVRTVTRDRRSLESLCEALMSEQGEASGTRLAAAVLDKYEAAAAEERVAFFALLTDRYDVDTGAIAAALSAYEDTRGAGALKALQVAAQPLRHELLKRLNRVPGATGRLVRMRADLLDLLNDHEEFRRTDLDFEQMFSAWFNRGFLVLRHIDWTTPANILDKIIEYEAVHAIGDWDDLRRRLAPRDRRCFAFFHPAMPDEPLIFVEVALTRDIPSTIHEVLAEDREPLEEGLARTAVFYSISNCQKGLAGVSFGNFLIKQVATDLSQTMPNLASFVTLSPLPGFARWLRKEGAEGAPAAALAEGTPDAETVAERRRDLVALAASYLLEAKRADGRPVDPVARFHLGNGARLERINPEANLSSNGIAQSLGIMVNYLYDLKKVEANHEAYARDREVIATRAVRGLLSGETHGRRRRQHAD